MTPREAWRRWSLAAGPWQGWAVCPALTTLDHAPPPRSTASPPPHTTASTPQHPSRSESLHPSGTALQHPSGEAAQHPSSTASPRAAARVAGLPPQLTRLVEQAPTLVLLDLDVCLGIHLAAELFRQSFAHPVLLIPRWPYAQAVLPTQPMLEVLLDEAANLPSRPGGPSLPSRSGLPGLHGLPGQPDRSREHAWLPSVAFVLDDQRGVPLPRRATDDPRADNRYRVSVADLPNLATVRARGISRIVKLAHAREEATVPPCDRPAVRSLAPELVSRCAPSPR